MTWWTTDADIADCVQNAGVQDFLEVKFYENRANGQSKGFCCVSVASEPSMRIIMEKLPKEELHGQVPVVTYATKQALHQFEAQSKTRPTTGPPAGATNGVRSSSVGPTGAHSQPPPGIPPSSGPPPSMIRGGPPPRGPPPTIRGPPPSQGYVNSPYYQDSLYFVTCITNKHSSYKMFHASNVLYEIVAQFINYYIDVKSATFCSLFVFFVVYILMMLFKIEYVKSNQNVLKQLYQNYMVKISRSSLFMIYMHKTFV